MAVETFKQFYNRIALKENTNIVKPMIVEGDSEIQTLILAIEDIKTGLNEVQARLGQFEKISDPQHAIEIKTAIEEIQGNVTLLGDIT